MRRNGCSFGLSSGARHNRRRALTTTANPGIEAPQPSLDMATTQTFMARIMGDMSCAITSLMCTLGDRLGLFKDLAMKGPATSAELAARTGTDERCVREWLSTLASAGYLEYEPESQRFTLQPEHAPVLAAE